MKGDTRNQALQDPYVHMPYGIYHILYTIYSMPLSIYHVLYTIYLASQSGREDGSIVHCCNHVGMLHTFPDQISETRFKYA